MSDPSYTDCVDQREESNSRLFCFFKPWARGASADYSFEKSENSNYHVLSVMRVEYRKKSDVFVREWYGKGMASK